MFCDTHFALEWEQTTEIFQPTPVLSENQKSDFCKEAEKKIPFQEGAWGRLIPVRHQSDLGLEIFDIKTELTFGRNQEVCDFTVNDSLVSGRHFRIFSRISKQVEGLNEACLEDLRFFF